MLPRVCAALAALVLLAVGADAAAAGVEPAPNRVLSGMVQFPRPQAMWIRTGERGARMTVALGFNGRCKGTIRELWGANVLARQTVRVRRGEFSATLTGSIRNLGRVKGRTAEFRWRLRGRFVQPELATATISGSATVTRRGRVVARCRIDPPAPVGLALAPSTANAVKMRGHVQKPSGLLDRR